ncbi:MAG: outer membrane beta-barrel protein [Verrucomicrobiota bacterium JB022]|nr:outer membrane beta-barrel protein [Verrucomicrobiota bacterium JB022]
MKRLLAPVAFALLGCSAWAVYAPVPEADRGEPLIIEAKVGSRYDSNIFGSHRFEQDSMVALFAPRVKGQASLGDQTFLQANYGLEASHYFDRPGDDTLLNHQLGVVLDYTPDARTFIRASEAVRYINDPKTIIPLGLDVDQSYWSHQSDVHAQWGLLPTIALGARGGLYGIRYDENRLARELDRDDVSAGGEVRWSVLPEVDLVGEANFSNVAYDQQDALRGSDTWDFQGGIDYLPGPRLRMGLRAGVETRERNDGVETDAFTGSISLGYRYLPQSQVSLMVSRELRETTVPDIFPQSKVTMVYLTNEHDLTGHDTLFLTTMLLYEHADLEVSPRFAAFEDDISDDTVRGGLGLSWRYRDNWRADLQYDLDLVTSDTEVREQERHRVSVSLSYSFAPLR